jgi:hypothetical protein
MFGGIGGFINFLQANDVLKYATTPPAQSFPVHRKILSSFVAKQSLKLE